MKKIFLSLTVTSLLCGALPQQTLARWCGNSERSNDIEMFSNWSYASVSTYGNDEAPKSSNACSRFLSNASHTASRAWSGLMQSRACDETWKKAAWINNIKHTTNNVHNAIEQGNAKWGAHTQEDTQNNVALNEQYVVQHSQDNQDVWHDAQEEQTNSHGSFGSDETNQAPIKPFIPR